jgi:hypothetical protein
LKGKVRDIATRGYSIFGGEPEGSIHSESFRDRCRGDFPLLIATDAGSAGFAERDFENPYLFSVADAFELAIEFGGGIVGVAIFILVFGFGLALLESVVEVGLGERVERDEREAESGCGRIKAPVVRIGGFFSAVPEALEKKYGGEERERGEESPLNDELEVHGVP